MKACAESFQFADITVKCVYKSTLKRLGISGDSCDTLVL